MNSTFATYHPIINFTYFAAVITFSMFMMHPIFLGISLISAFTYTVVLKGKKAIYFGVMMLPTLLLIALINPAFNHEGVTILTYVRDNPITLESILYGLATATMLIAVIMWFSAYNIIMTSDKFIYLFGKVIPGISLIFSMVLRFVPKFQSQIKVISNGQKCIGRDVTNGTSIEKAKNGVKIVSIMTTWALENAIITADSMKSRGYGLKGRSSFSLYRFDSRDKSLLGIILLLIAIVIWGTIQQVSGIKYFPSIIITAQTPLAIFVYLAYFALCILPCIIDILEEQKWKHMK